MGSVFVLRVSCDARYPHIIDDITQVVERVHVGGSVCHVKAPGSIVVQNGWKHWPCRFRQHGPGRKHERELILQPCQRLILDEFPADFLRGLFHSDGCRFQNATTRMVRGEKKRYEYGRWMFTNNSAEIQVGCKESLDQLGIPWRQSFWKTIAVSTREGVAQLDDLIGAKS